MDQVSKGLIRLQEQDHAVSAWLLRAYLCWSAISGGQGQFPEPLQDKNLRFRACKEELINFALSWNPRGLHPRRKGEEEADCMTVVELESSLNGIAVISLPVFLDPGRSYHISSLEKNNTLGLIISTNKFPNTMSAHN